uniref:interleukin-1 receptor type 2 n=1 Tax=Euleptes europaea TaxID=460621 RepID=UPI002540492F|nr:interleukin-1 receptor type 2 [Euleptes europaea]
MGWMRVNKLELNPDKTDVLWVSRKADQGPESSPVVEGVTLPLRGHIHSLGVLLDIVVTLENRWLLWFRVLLPRFSWSQCVILPFSLSCFVWNLPLILYIFGANLMGALAFRIQRVRNADDCQDHTTHFRPTFALAGEPMILRCPPFRYKNMDATNLSLNLTWYKNDSTTFIPAGRGEKRILPQGDMLWFLPASLQDSGEYICTHRNSSYCADVSVYLQVFDKSAAREISFFQKAFTLSHAEVVCASLEGFVQKNTSYELKWYKDSTPLNIDDTKFIASKGTDHLTITSVTSDDAGYYSCQMTFEHETTQYNITRTIHLQILGNKLKSKPVIIYPTERIVLAAIGSRLIIPCKVYVAASNEFYTDVWWQANDAYIDLVYRKGRVIESKRQERVENNDTYIEVSLIFDPVKEEDFKMDFKCMATNTRGHQMHMTQVKQEEPSLSWYFSAIPVALVILILGGVCIHKCWKQRSAIGYILTKF